MPSDEARGGDGGNVNRNEIERMERVHVSHRDMVVLRKLLPGRTLNDRATDGDSGPETTSLTNGYPVCGVVAT